MAMAKRPDRSPTSLRTAILVLGMHRSGTSALARIVNFLGAGMPRHLMPAGPSNPRGHWESAPLVALHDQLLAALDSSWDDWRTPGARWKERDAAARFAGRLRLTIDEEYGNAPLIVLKDPRMCRTLPYWMSILEKSGIRSAPLIIVRNPLEVAESLNARDGMSFEKAMLLWLRHMLDAEFETRHLARNIVTFDALLEDWKLLAAQTAGRLGITWPRQPHDAAHDVREFLDLELHNHRATQAELEAHTEVPHWVKAAYRALTLLCDEPKSAEPKRELDKVRHAFAESAKIFGVEAFAQTAALKQAEIEAAEAKQRADGADAARAELAKARESNASLSARVKTLETDLAKTTARATELQRSNHDLETALAHVKAEFKDTSAAADNYQRRAEEAERRVAELSKQLSGLERTRVAQEAMKRVTSDTAELKTLAKHLSERTELIEGQLRAQLKKSDKTTAELETTRSELKTALQNAMKLSKDLAAAKEQLHANETRAIKATAEASKHQAALTAARGRIAELEADDRASQSEIAELRAELAEAWSLTGSHKHHQPVAVVVASTAERADGEPRAKRVEDDLRFERMHVEQLERRLGSWMGLASAALRKITRLGRKPPARKPVRRRLAATPATSGT